MQKTLFIVEKFNRAKFWASQKFVAKACFIHINKCGGTSVEKALGLPKVHDTASERRSRVGEAAWRRMYKFAVVRHPYCKVVSHYNYRVRTNQTNLAEDKVDLNTWIIEAYEDQSPRYFDNPTMFAPCYAWISDQHTKEIIVDDVFKLEELSDFWPTIASRAGSPRAKLMHENRTVESKLADAKAQLSDRAKQIIQEKFDDDFRAFKYSK